jgi:tetratricopeptide (TPR) repeat protein
MGVVLSARDLSLSREVAIKTLLPSRVSADAVRRFVTEAQVTARLPHPGVPPVHALGELPDGRPFLAMKLIRGRTLADLLRDRANPADDLPRFVAIFEQVCQAVGYAHARRVIHRDLKPSNVMVGAFGEVQVMDWGLAKVLADRPPPPGAGGGTPVGPPTGPAVPHPSAQTVAIPPADRSPLPDLTRTGSVLGSPGYMAPEQARGEIDRLDERADVFGLGAILCTVLTGASPFAGRDLTSILINNVTADLGGARSRLARCGADPDLVALCERCLAPESADRPRDAGEVARAVAALRAAADERAQAAELERAAAAARASEERKRRRMQLVLAVVAGLILLAGGWFAWWLDDQNDRRRAEVMQQDAEWKLQGRYARQGVDAALKLAADLRRQYKFREAADVLAQASEQLTTGLADDLTPVVEWAKADLAFVRDLDDIRMRTSIRVVGTDGRGQFDTASAPPAYREAFRVAGYDLAAGDPADLAKRVRSSAVRQNLVDALDDWSLDEPDPVLVGRLLEVAGGADPGPWKERFRTSAVRADRAKLARLAEEADPAALSAVAVVTLAALMERQGADAAPLLTIALNHHPADFRVPFFLGQRFFDADPVLAIDHYRTARAIRPDNVVVLLNLAAMFRKVNDQGSAVAALREAIRLDPGSARANADLGDALGARGEAAGAEAAYREAIRLDPRDPAPRLRLGRLLTGQGRQAEAQGYLKAGRDLGGARSDATAAEIAPPPRPVK